MLEIEVYFLSPDLESSGIALFRQRGKGGALVTRRGLGGTPPGRASPGRWAHVRAVETAPPPTPAQERHGTPCMYVYVCVHVCVCVDR